MNRLFERGAYYRIYEKNAAFNNNKGRLLEGGANGPYSSFLIFGLKTRFWGIMAAF